MARYGELTGRRYGPVEAYRLEDADWAIVGMGSLTDTAMATADWIRREKGWRVGILHVTAFRPFPARGIVAALRHVTGVAVIERMDNPGAQSNPLTLEVKAAFADAVMDGTGAPGDLRIPAIHSGIAGLGSRDIRPGDFVATVANMVRRGARVFALGIDHPLALRCEEDPDVRPPGAFSMRGHSVGGFGSVATNRVIATVLGDLFHLRVQAYPLYGSEKKGLPTTYYLTVADDPIHVHAELTHVDFVPLNDVNAFRLGNPLAGLTEGGMLFVQSTASDPEAIWAGIPEGARQLIAQRDIRVLALDTLQIAREVAGRPELRQRMQGIVLLGVFLRVTPFREQRGLDEDAVFSAVERSLRKVFGKRGEQVIRDNMTAVRRGYEEVIEVPREVMRGAARSATRSRVSE
jgi:pyruvate-ferredoxin/flavodoxin oxidoreductase